MATGKAASAGTSGLSPGTLEAPEPRGSLAWDGGGTGFSHTHTRSVRVSRHPPKGSGLVGSGWVSGLGDRFSSSLRDPVPPPRPGPCLPGPRPLASLPLLLLPALHLCPSHLAGSHRTGCSTPSLRAFGGCLWSPSEPRAASADPTHVCLPVLTPSAPPPARRHPARAPVLPSAGNPTPTVPAALLGHVLHGPLMQGPRASHPHVPCGI